MIQGLGCVFDIFSASDDFHYPLNVRRAQPAVGQGKRRIQVNSSLEMLDREWRRSRRERMPLTVIFVDVDHFQAYNRQFGRDEGDRVLKSIGRALTNVVGRPGDLVARYHRDEFAMVLASTDSAGASTIAEHIRGCIEALQEPSAKDAPSSVVTASVAMATALPQRESAWEELDLIKAARHALREARATGGNRVIRATMGMAGPPELWARA